MRRVRLKRAAIFIHRWMGVAFCLLFAWWFLSGIFMMYWDFPEVTERDRLAHAHPLDASRIARSPREAYAALQLDEPPEGVALTMFDGRPVYRFRIGRGDEQIVYADDGKPLIDFPPELLRRVAAAWTGQSAEAPRAEAVKEVDQWTVGGIFRALQPLWKFTWADGEQVYVSEATGEVAQYTTRGSRIGAYLGPIPHWLYFTPLRKNGRLWSRIVIWLSAVATVAALFGLIVGVWMYAPFGRASVPYTGAKRLHMIIGLFFGIIACTWAFSGMLSMEPFPPADDRAERTAGMRIARALEGTRPGLDAFADKPPQQALAEVPPDFRVKELELTSYSGEPAYLARETLLRTHIIPIHGAGPVGFDWKDIADVARQAVKPATLAEAGLLTEYDAYYLDRRHERPLPVVLVRLNDGANTRFYIDPETAQVVGSYSSRSWATRWLYHGLHSINLPWLYNHRPAWDLVVLTLLAGGSALSVTSIVIAGQLLRRKLRLQ